MIQMPIHNYFAYMQAWIVLILSIFRFIDNIIKGNPSSSQVISLIISQLYLQWACKASLLLGPHLGYNHGGLFHT